VIDLSEFERPLFFTGAGLSSESGIPTYRGAGGIWHEYDYQEYACQRAFDRDPEKVWDFHDLRRAKVAEADPAEGHRLIARVQERLPGTNIVTQNIDGLHQRAGAKDIIELHGSLWRLRCADTGAIVENFDVPLAERRCSGDCYWRPDIVWFEDAMNRESLWAAERALAACDVLISIGTSGVVYPAAELPRIAVQRGIPCVEINPEETAVSAWYTHQLRGGASEMLARLTDW
jgi:NAD-dependent deacetylase